MTWKKKKKTTERGSTPDAVLLAPRATERFLRPVKPAGCAQGSKIQQIPGQLSGDSDSVNGHTEPRTLQIFQKVNYRLSDSIRWAFLRSTIRSWVARASVRVHACMRGRTVQMDGGHIWTEQGHNRNQSIKARTADFRNLALSSSTYPGVSYKLNPAVTRADWKEMSRGSRPS